MAHAIITSYVSFFRICLDCLYPLQLCYIQYRYMYCTLCHGSKAAVSTQEAKYVESWPDTTSAWAGRSLFDIPVDRKGGQHYTGVSYLPPGQPAGKYLLSKISKRGQCQHSVYSVISTDVHLMLHRGGTVSGVRTRIFCTYIYCTVYTVHSAPCQHCSQLCTICPYSEHAVYACYYRGKTLEKINRKLRMS